MTETLYLSGAAMTASMGLPDQGIITVDEVAFFIRQIAQTSELPLLVDGDTIFPEALTSVERFREVRARLPGVKLLANMTEFGRTPALTAEEFQELGYDMVIWPVSSLRVANKAQERFYAALARDGATTAMLPEMQTRAQLYELIGLNAFEALDASIAQSVLPA
ncbi:isocitrate lyase/phosphoenolpyruvate mutase family protein [Paracoccus denitrificans]|uniref:PEP phosphonomutase and related enzymes-like protein n=1 Tax=Paracoccus denitrificans (strain Pd 1222) TaxID=318586 RepID=A1B6C5_PARDP|nr:MULTISPECIES: isocitrate lyase/phosphoenolpyruvate mutase family protein [Paracoccus]ABL71069.1 PEP phosphonomutase and related enzymes-like protein [Paracoccus denitrificans PD1222]MBB4628332.1 methylisocitrate lyase [Paracoccus denitrificans]MCU7429387.1 isocitrate lyase/phosphoenolpyruvate mutase family protein [Paracoccus denitrificans]UPV97431.1 isocitrate lyase/phosphoenolpyruvate mutase family protein [Paracoccus denitrificans]WQO35343.1 isocitrate lyase/phosphoenolpyruvate mutase fa